MREDKVAKFVLAVTVLCAFALVVAGTFAVLVAVWQSLYG